MPKPELYVSRKDLGWGACPAGRADPKSGLVIHYDSSNQNLANRDHSACIAYWQRTRKFHTGPSRNWADIGYSFMGCPHSYILEGRGLFRAQAAQPGGNSTYYSVTLATGPTDEITDAQINAVRQLREWLMEPKSSIAGTVKGHRDFISTSCPGDKAYALVRNGTFTKPAVWGTGALPTSPSSKEFLDMSDFTWYSSKTHRSLPKGKLVAVEWDNSHNKKVTATNPYTSIVFENKKFTGSLNGRLVGLDTDGNLIPVAYRVQLGKVDGAAATDAEPKLLFPGGVFTTTEFNMSLDEVTLKGERLRVYITALTDGVELRYGKITGWTAPR